MKFIFATLATLIATGAAVPGMSSELGIDIREENGKLVVREAPVPYTPGVLAGYPESKCRECVGQGGRCTIGDGSCYKESPPMYCTWCGDVCKSICVRNGQTCEETCR